MDAETFDAIVLAGGGSRRLGGEDKAEVIVAGESMLDRVLDAAAPARKTIVVGPERPTNRPVEWTSEQPAGAGPVAALAAGVALSDAPVVIVLAVDHPFVTPSEVDRLVQAVAADGAVLRDDEGRRQPLVAAYRKDALTTALGVLGELQGASVAALVEQLSLVEIDGGRAARDCDTWDDIESARALAEKGE